MGAFGGGMLGGGMFGGMGGGRGGFAGGTNGLPFAGIPDELKPAVERLVDREPVHPEPAAVFTQIAPPQRRLTFSGMLAEHRRQVVTAAVLVTIEAACLQVGPILAQVGIDHGIIPHHAAVVVTAGLIYVGAVLLTIVAERARVRFAGRIAANIMHDLRIRVFTQLQRLSLDFYTEEKAGVIMTRMTSDIEVLQQLLQDGFASFAIQGLTMLIVTVVLLSYNLVLALIVLVIVVPALSLLTWWFKTSSLRIYLRIRDGLAAVISDLAESLSGVRVVLANNRRRYNVVSHRSILGVYRRENIRGAHTSALFGAASDGIGLAGQVIVLIIGGEMVLHHHLTVGELTLFVLYLGTFFQPIQQLVQQYNTLQQGQAAVSKLRSLLETEPSVVEAPAAIALPPIDGEIRLDDVSFGYQPGRLVLCDVDLVITPGETVAFVGPTGAGKSTIAKLVTRFYDPTRGAVRIDGHDLRDVTMHSLRRQLGVVPQEPFLFSGTLRDNVAFASPGASDAEVLGAIGAVGLGELVERLPAGLDTPVHERGQSLSSGERQLIALARAFLAQPRVLVLDEATSNLDLASEAKVEAALDVLLEGRTAILIAHRLSTAMRADRIVVIEDGRVIDEGSHDELMARHGRYAEMYETWMRQGMDAEAA